MTIDGVVAVIDSGLARIAGHSPWSRAAHAAASAKISQASATQRAGRAGRTRPGARLRLYTRHDFEARPAHDVPEIRAADLAETLLALRALGRARPARAFAWFEAPPAARAGRGRGAAAPAGRAWRRAGR